MNLGPAVRRDKEQAKRAHVHVLHTAGILMYRTVAELPECVFFKMIKSRKKRDYCDKSCYGRCHTPQSANLMVEVNHSGNYTLL